MPRTLLAAFALALPLVAAGQEPTKRDYTELSKLIHRIVAKQVPRSYEENFDWGKTIPIPEKKLPLAALRTVVKVGDKLELPHGAWRKVRIRLADADKDLKIVVRDFKAMGKGYRLVIDAEVKVTAEGEWQQWQKGLMLVTYSGDATAELATTMAIDVNAEFDLKKFPPELKIEPKVAEMTLDLKDFTLRRLSGTVEGERVREIGNNLMRDGLRDLMKVAEPVVKEYANEAIAESLKRNKGALSAAELFKALPKDAKK